MAGAGAGSARYNKLVEAYEKAIEQICKSVPKEVLHECFKNLQQNLKENGEPLGKGVIDSLHRLFMEEVNSSVMQEFRQICAEFAIEEKIALAEERAAAKEAADEYEISYATPEVSPDQLVREARIKNKKQKVEAFRSRLAALEAEKESSVGAIRRMQAEQAELQQEARRQLQIISDIQREVAMHNEAKPTVMVQPHPSKSSADMNAFHSPMDVER
eukprot:TRINITY_DN4688_c0_g1_i1.p1 TRINITY_DN4688_c0_g1~~TRINITY_DN4688_c0_g1_i1.p1  ORF type:complete len:238 (-),score=73.17 TRINITY_DN4688_c0_g1_i1:77-724(-)